MLTVIGFCQTTYVKSILGYHVDSDPSVLLDPEINIAIESLLKDPILPSVFERSFTFYLPDSAM